MHPKDLSTSNARFTPEETRRLLVQGFFTKSGVVYEERLAGRDGMSFTLVKRHLNTDEHLRSAVDQLRRDRDVVGPILVSSEPRKGVAELILDWQRLGDVPITWEADHIGEIEEAFLHFPVGTHREAIWRWFTEENPEFPLGELMNGAFSHPFTNVNLKDVIRHLADSSRLCSYPMPRTLVEARQVIQGMADATSFNWLTGAAWLDVLDSAIDGRDLRASNRLL